MESSDEDDLRAQALHYLARRHSAYRLAGRIPLRQQLPPVEQDSAYEFPGSELTEEQWRFGQAMERYKRKARRPFPSWLEALNVAKDLGYRKAPE